MSAEESFRATAHKLLVEDSQVRVVAFLADSISEIWSGHEFAERCRQRMF